MSNDKLTPEERREILSMQLDHLIQVYTADKPHGLMRLANKYKDFADTCDEIQKRNEARGYKYGWVKGRFVVLKTPEECNESGTKTKNQCKTHRSPRGGKKKAGI